MQRVADSWEYVPAALSPSIVPHRSWVDGSLPLSALAVSPQLPISHSRFLLLPALPRVEINIVPVQLSCRWLLLSRKAIVFAMAVTNKRNSSSTTALFPKDWLDIHMNAADHDWKLISQKVESLTAPISDFANSFNREWENFRRTSLSLSNFQSTENKVSDMNHIRNAKIIGFWRPPPSFKFDQFSVQKAQAKESCIDDLHSKEIFDKKLKSDLKFPLDWKEMKLALQEWQKNKKENGRYSLQEWEPLRRLRVSLMELEVTAAASTTPGHFLENLQRIEFFENTKKIMNLPSSHQDPSSCHQPLQKKESLGYNSSSLDVPEFLESLVNQSEHLLCQLGVKKGFSEKIFSVLECWKNYQQPVFGPVGSDKDVAMLLTEARKATEELDSRIARILHRSGYKYQGDIWGQQAFFEDTGEHCKRTITIATTASLPWMTGTAVNPLLRAAYLARNGDVNVMLLIPWLSKKDQQLVYPNKMTFISPHEQEIFIREWLGSRIDFEPDFKIVFYPGKFSLARRSILPVDDITQFISREEADIAVLEEPEHLTWYHHGARWTQKFNHVVGVVHTNYLEYVKREKNGPFQAFLLKYVNNWVTNIYCHKVIRLSAATQNLPKSIVCNVHGVSSKFLEIGKRVIREKERGHKVFTSKAYFLGKMVWGKGYRELLDLWVKHKDVLNNIQLDVFGTGEDSSAVREEASKNNLQMKFYEGRDHTDSSLHSYKVFINPSVSDVVCTTTAEALAMGKIVVCADHPSNNFFKSFPNCYTYKSSEDFLEKVKSAMVADPLPLSPEQQHMLSWEAATERFMKSSELDRLLVENKGPSVDTRKDRSNTQVSRLKVTSLFDHGMFLAHYCLSGIEIARLASGAIPGTIHMDEEQQRDLGLVSSIKDEIQFS